MNLSADRFHARSGDAEHDAIGDGACAEDEVWPSEHRFAFERFEEIDRDALKLRAEEQKCGEAVETAEAMSRTEFAIVRRQ